MCKPWKYLVVHKFAFFVDWDVIKWTGERIWATSAHNHIDDSCKYNLPGGLVKMTG